MKCADLHFHTTHSDGKHSVAQLVDWLKAQQKSGLSLGVLTDHDGVFGFEEFSEATKKWWPSLCASELSCGFKDPQTNEERECHLLVYGLDPKDSNLIGLFQKFREARRNRFFKICDKLKEKGMVIDAEKIAREHPGSLGRPHIADALVELGAVQSRNEAFEKYLKSDRPFVVAKWRLPLEEAMSVAKKMGAKASIAHPGQYGFELPQLSYFRDIGVDAIEIFHPRHDAEKTQHYLELSHKMGFKRSGGSDFHTRETDLCNGLPSLGQTQYALEEAKAFLGDLI